MSGLAYGFVLLGVPDIQVASLQDVEKYYARMADLDKILPTSQNISDENRSTASFK